MGWVLVRAVDTGQKAGRSWLEYPQEGLTQQQEPLSCQQAWWGGGGGYCRELFGAEGVANGNT